MRVPQTAIVAASGLPLLVLCAAIFAVVPPVRATPQFAKATGKPCAQCHTDPKGGASLTALGTAFKANGNKLPVSSAGPSVDKPAP
jgi:hypothetical protein